MQSVMNVVKDLTSEGSLVAETPLMEAGIDSLASTEVVSRLSDLSGVSLEPTLIFAHPSARQIAAHLLELLGVSEPAVQPAPSQAPAVAGMKAARSSVIVRAFCGRWPGGTASSASLRSLTHAAANAVSTVPAERWLLSSMMDGEPAVGMTGLLGLAVRHSAGLTYRRNAIWSNELPHPFV